ncbi:MAG: SCO family protein [Phycisphaerales bacterium]|jgi:protein SCO1/2|nr:SCO family protein [Phycisphaerales bacterium]
MNHPLCDNLKIMLLAIASVLLIAPVASGQRLLERGEVKELNGVEVSEQLGNHVPLDAIFTNSNGDEIEFGSYFDGDTPVILVMVYYECPVVCPVVLSQLSASLNKLDYIAGEDFKLLVVSFDQAETTTLALGERTKFLDGYTKGAVQASRDGIAFHTGDVVNIRRLVNSVGFAFNPLDNGEYSHPISLMILSPKGKVTRYMYGFDYPSQELKLSLLDASQGKIAASLGDRLLHFCYRFDPTAGSYSIQAFRVMQVGALLTVVLIIIGLTILFMGERVRRKLYIASLEESQDNNSDHHTDSHSSTTSSSAFGTRTNTGHVS